MHDIPEQALKEACARILSALDLFGESVQYENEPDSLPTTPSGEVA